MRQCLSVLVVDDSEPVRSLVSHLISERYNVESADCAKSALELIHSKRFEIVVTDIRMPEKDGLSLLSEIKEIDPNILVIMMTAHSEKENTYEALRRGAFDFIEKPISTALLNSALARAEETIQLRKKLKLVEENQAFASKMISLGEMAAGIAHEINNPLAIIQGYAWKLKAIAESEGETKKDLIAELSNKIETTTDRAAGIVKGLRKFSCDSTSEKKIITPLLDIVCDTLGLCQQRLTDASIDLRVSGISSEISVECSPIQISQVLFNLISNAFDAVHKQEKAWIKISAEEQDNLVVIRVSDSGPGVSEPFRHRIFEPFFTTKEVGRGTGLGLSVSSGIISSHGGSIFFNETTNDSCFEIQLPKLQNKKAKAVS